MFAVVFGIFIVATLVLCVLVVRWAIKRDKALRSEMSQSGTEMEE